MNFNSNIFYLMIAIGVMLASCVKNREFDTPKNECSNEDFTIISILELKKFYTDKTVQIQEDIAVQGYVISSDKEGNFFNIIYFQDAPANPTEGLQLELELRDSHLFFDVGQQITIKLKGLYLGQSNGDYKIGGVFTSFGNISVGRLPKNVVFDHVLVSCKANNGIQLTSIAISELNENMVNTLVRVNNVEFKLDELGKSYAVKEEETLRTLVDCSDKELVLVNSGYSDFQSKIVPDKMGNATGILTFNKNEYQLIIRNENDLDFNEERCEDLIDEFTSNSILITEIADPDNNAGARFVELYNSDNERLSLNGWSLLRYTNDNTEVSSTIDLSDFVMEGKEVLVISPNAEEFEEVYDFAPDISAGTNSPADSNGDDNIVLVDPFGKIIDLFGVVGQDGSNTNHEFEDGRAVRNIDIEFGSPVFKSSEWIIYNDTGNEGTLNQPQNAPVDFTPGRR
ncbi:hypothetical protein LCGC14_0069240 [marine sediment metagenome]|uniref:LTD domain-containing protein n=2 Tax=root TaxID=1 RepID=A0A0F9Y210_9ZZZZ|nr:lamin tail domain-containing protein [Maribacter sp.]HEA81878.1 lamin tail domain-containing protein [Maribacter sp.]